MNIETFFEDKENRLNFSLIYVNIRSMRRNFNDLLLELNEVINSVHFIVLSEIWIGSDEVSLYNIPGFRVFCKCNDSYRAGGVLCFVKESIFVSVLNFEMETADILTISVKMRKAFFKLVILYRLQRFSEGEFIQELSRLLDNVKGNVLYVGDININLLSKEGLALTYHSLLDNNGFLSMINNHTRISNTSATCIDHIFIRHKNVNLFESGIFDIGVTDHCVLGLKLFNASINTKGVAGCNKMTKYFYDKTAIKHNLKDVNWGIVFDSNDVNISYNRFHDILSESFENSKKVNNLTNKLSKAKQISPWITSGILNKIKKRKRLHKIHRRRPYDVRYTNYYQNFCNNLKNEIDRVKNTYYKDKLEACGGDASQQWKIINELTGRVSNKSVDRVELDNGELVCEPVVVAKTINDYLIDVQSGQTSVPSSGTASAGAPPIPPLYQCPTSLFLTPTSVEEVKKTIGSLKNKKSTGFDNFTVEIIKYVADEISPVLAHIINLSYVKGVFPNKLKQSVVVPIWKKNNSINLDNLRPISLLSVFSKIIEKVTKVRLLSYLNNIHFFSIRQFGFTTGKSTEDALISVTEQIYNNWNSNQKTTGIFIDFKKAFDFVNHSILLNKMEAVGIRGVALEWFRSFFMERKQKVKIGNILSDPLIVRSGVPQGSVTSATLFLIFINDLLNLPFKGTINAFADDIALFYSHEQERSLSENIGHDLALLRNWCVLNCMEVNVSKTKYINFDFTGYFFTSPLKFHNINCSTINCDCQIIEQVSSFKYLGVTLDEKLSWEIHISDLHKKLRSSIRTFYFLRNFCDESLLRSLYFALIHSRLQYGIQCWGGTFKYLIDRLRVTQNFFLRIILRKNLRDSSFPLYNDLKILPIQHLFIYKVLRIFYVRSGNRQNFNRYYSTRNTVQGIFILPKVKKIIFRRSLSYLGPKFFNQIPGDIKLVNSKKRFSNKVFQWLMNQSDVSYMTLVLS
jgi:hypothetical protein